MLSGCNNNPETSSIKTTTESKASVTTVELTAGNFSDYVATNSSSSFNVNTNYTTYYTHFVGAHNCVFIGCTVTYQYVVNGNEPSEAAGTTVSLTISGDGEANPFHVKVTSGYNYYVFRIISASGTVKIPE